MKKKSIVWNPKLIERKAILSSKDESTLKKAIDQYNLEMVALLLTSLDGEPLKYFFTQEVVTKRGAHTNGWLKILALDIYRLTKNCATDGTNQYSTNQYNSEAFKKILIKLLTLFDIETLTRDFIERHEFSELVQNDIQEVISQYQTDISHDAEEATASSSDGSEPDSSGNSETAVKTDSLSSQEIKDPLVNRISLLSKNTESNRAKSEDNTENNTPIIQNEFLIWLYSLPEEVLESLLKLSSIQNLITHFKEIQNILTTKAVTDSFAELFNSSLEALHQSIWGDSSIAIQSTEVRINYDIPITPEFYPSLHETSDSDIFHPQMILPSLPEIFPCFGSSLMGLNDNMGDIGLLIPYPN